MWSIKVPEWMITAARIATGNRRRVLEDGPDVMNSEDEDSKKEEHGEKLTGMYAPGCSSLDQARLTEQQAQEQRATCSSQDFPSNVLASLGFEPERKPTPSANPDDEDWSWMSPSQRKLAETARRTMEETALKALPAPEPTKRKVELTAQAPAKGPSLDIKTKAAAPPRAPADQPTGAKAPKQMKGQESPETKVSTPMVTRKQAQEDASRAGGLRSGGGSRQTGTRVAQGNPPKT
jgi:hypothetical protein